MHALSTNHKAYHHPDWDARVRLPDVAEGVPQDEEWCEVLEDGAWNPLRFHDYAAIYRRPGLYEHLFYHLLRCSSPERVARMLNDVRVDRGELPRELRVLDLGAGNGMLGEELSRLGHVRLLGLDILEEARAAARRDRPGVYQHYLVADLTAPSEALVEELERFAPTCLTSVAALGFGDIPARAWFNAARMVPRGGLLAFNIKSDFLDARYWFGFSELVRRMLAEGVVQLEALRRYPHRISTAGEPLTYTAIVATKLAEIPEAMLVDDR